MKKNKKVPDIRFEGFTKAWKQCRFGDLASSFKYGLNVAAKEFDGKNKYIRITDIDDDSREFNQNNIKSPDVDLLNVEKYKLTEGDILFARTGASVGKTYIYKDSDGLVYYAGFLIRARIKKEFNPEFVFQNTLTKGYDKFIKVTSMRSGQPGVNAQEYSQFEVLVPPKNEQEEIGSYFRNLDNLSILHQRKLEKLLDLKKSMMYKLFPKEGEAIPEIRFDGFSGEWKKKKLGDCFSERTESFPDGELLSVTINQGIKKFSELNRKNNSNENKNKYKKVHIGDIAYNSMRMWQGASGYSPFEGIVSPAYTVLNPKEGIDSKCFSYLFKRADIIHMFQLYSKGITSDNWNLKYPDFKELEVYVSCDYNEQKAIGEYFYELDKLIELNREKLGKLKKIKSSLLDKMFV